MFSCVCFLPLALTENLERSILKLNAEVSGNACGEAKSIESGGLTAPP